MGWPFFIYNSEIVLKQKKQKLQEERKKLWDEKLKSDPDFYLDSYDLDNIWSADNVMNILNHKIKNLIPVYKIELDKQIISADGTKYWTTKKIFVRYKDI